MTLLPSSTADSAAIPGPLRDNAERDALAAPIADALWLLARQWQTGEFVATDGGSPVGTELGWADGPLQQSGIPVRGPLEPVVEAEPPPVLVGLDTRDRLRLGVELRRTLRDSLPASVVDPLWTAWTTAYAFAPDSGQRPAATRMPDPVPLVTLVSPALTRRRIPFPILPGTPGLDAATIAVIQGAVRLWFTWARRFFSVAGSSPAPAAWIPSELGYSLVTTALPTDPVQLSAAAYDGTGLDWYSVDRSAFDPAHALPGTSRNGTVAPTPVTYAGMPRPRWWEFEDGEVNLDALRSSPDPSHTVLAAFAHSFSNDWFLCPLELPPGWALITSLTVTDTFGTRIPVPGVAAVDNDAGPWRMWDLTRPDGPADPATGLRLAWPVSPPPLESAVVEEVLLARDEFANLAWAIEIQTTDAAGALVDRYRRWLELRPTEPTDPDRELYRLGTPVADFWYPFTLSGQPGNRQFRWAALPPEASGVPDTGVQGALLPHDSTTALSAAAVGRQGRRIVRRDRLIMGADGIQVWRARVGGPGTGDASSGLRFDLLE